MTKQQEFNPEELPDENDKESNENYSGHSPTYLLQEALFYLLLRNSPGEVLRFLKKIRTPHHAKFAKALTQLYATVKM